MLQRLARFRVPLGFFLAATVLYLATPDGAALALGFPVAGAGLVLRASAAGTIRKNSALATKGPYRLTRNPLYFGSFLLALGFAAMSGSPIAAVALLLPFALIYPTVIGNEERHLARAFGSDFEEFRRTVPCFLPRTLSLRIFESFSREQYLANREYNAAIGFLLATAVLLWKYAASNA